MVKRPENSFGKWRGLLGHVGSKSVAFDEELALRVREELMAQPGIVEKPMFGGLAFLIQGNLSVCVQGSELMVRVAPKNMSGALADPDARIFDLSGRKMNGWILVRAEGLKFREPLAWWIRQGTQYASSLPSRKKEL